jgi:hypothetical protein
MSIGMCRYIDGIEIRTKQGIERWRNTRNRKPRRVFPSALRVPPPHRRNLRYINRRNTPRESRCGPPRPDHPKPNHPTISRRHQFTAADLPA